MKKFLLAALLVLISLPAFAQQSHYVTLAWDHPVDSTTANPGYVNVYRCLGNQPTNFTLLATNVSPDGPYTDNTVVAGSYFYYVTLVVNSLESAPSNTAHAVLFPATITGVKSKGQ